MKQTNHVTCNQFGMVATASCWYCNRRLAEIGRFCDKVCAEAFEEDEMAMERRMVATTQELIAGLITRNV